MPDDRGAGAIPHLLDTAEGRRIVAAARDGWRRWGPYLSERQWGTVREDYSPGGTAWEYFPHDHARSPASAEVSGPSCHGSPGKPVYCPRPPGGKKKSGTLLTKTCGRPLMNPWQDRNLREQGVQRALQRCQYSQWLCLRPVST